MLKMYKIRVMVMSVAVHMCVHVQKHTTEFFYLIEGHLILIKRLLL